MHQYYTQYLSPFIANKYWYNIYFKYSKFNISKLSLIEWIIFCVIKINITLAQYMNLFYVSLAYIQKHAFIVGHLVCEENMMHIHVNVMEP